MNPSQQIILSASRRTDIPAFYMPWFMEQLDKGYFKVVNPFNQRVSIVPGTPQAVHTVVFWSKNFGPFIDGSYGERMLEQGYHLFFNFTINSDNAILEPNVPPLKERFDQLEYLCGRFGSRLINWRFDPICHYETGRGARHNNLNDFSYIAEQAAAAGIERCITSFMDYYPKINKRLTLRPDLVFIDPPQIEKINTFIEMEIGLAKLNIQLTTCCEREILAALPIGSSIQPSSCIPNDLIRELYGGNISLKKDSGQRIKAGCGCKVSVDIGSYGHHPCYHNCLFCYANPTSGPVEKEG
jgi:hypothetical protein